MFNPLGHNMHLSFFKPDVLPVLILNYDFSPINKKEFIFISMLVPMKFTID
jgi:hypothetical protein